MRYRRFGKSDLEVSEVGFGVWTLASNWWGEVDDKQGLLHAALDGGINFIDTAPVYGEGGVGEELLADILKTHARRDRAHHQVRLRHRGRPQVARPERAPARLAARIDSAPSSRARCAASASSCIDLYQLHNTRIDPILDDALWDELEKFRAEGKIRELGVALGPAIGWVDEGIEAIRDRPIVSLQTVFNVIEQEPGLTFAARAERAERTSASSPACPTRPTRCRARSRATPCSRPATTARTATTTTCSTTSTRRRRSRSSGRAPAARSRRPRSPGSSPTRTSPRCCPRASPWRTSREFAAASDLRSRRTRTPELDAPWATTSRRTATRCR